MSKTIEWVHQASWPAELSSLVEARQFVCDVLGWHHQPLLVDRVRLVMHELATNAIVHAETPYTVMLQFAHMSVVLRVRDGAPLPETFGASLPASPRGKGLYMVDAYSNGWGVAADRDGGKSVWALFTAERSPVPGSSDDLDYGRTEQEYRVAAPPPDPGGVRPGAGRWHTASGRPVRTPVRLHRT